MENVEVGLPDEAAVLDFNWIPYRCSVIANRVSACLQGMYGERFQLSVAGWRLMFVLGRYAPLSAKEVGERTAMDQVQVTRAINQMASVKLISRRVDTSDRRRVILRLSRRGLDAYAEIAPLARRIEREIVAPLSPAENVEFARLLGKVFEHAEAILPDRVDWRLFMGNQTEVRDTASPTPDAKEDGATRP